MLSCLTLSIIRYVSRVKKSNPGKGVAPSPTPRCSSYRKGSLRVTLDYGHQLYLRTAKIKEPRKKLSPWDNSIFFAQAIRTAHVIITMIYLRYWHNETKQIHITVKIVIKSKMRNTSFGCIYTNTNKENFS